MKTKKGLFRVLARVLVVGSILGLPITAWAQVATISAKPLEGWVADVKEICRISFPGELATPIIDGLDKLAGPDGLAGLDFKRSLGAFADIPKEGETPLVVFVLPVTDAKLFLESVKRLGLGVDEQPNSKTYTHVVTLPNGATKLYAYPTGKHLYLGMFPYPTARLASIRPADLDTVRPKSSELTASIRLDRLPAAMVNTFLAQFEASLALKEAREPNETEPAFLGRKFAQDLGKKWVSGIVRDGKEIALDVELDPKAGPMGLEMRVVAKSGSDMAAACNAFGKRASVFRALRAGSVMDAYGVLPVPKDLQAFVKKLADLMRKDAEEKLKNSPEKELKAAKAMTSIIERILASDSWDAVAAVKGPYPAGDAQVHSVIIGVKVPDGPTMEKEFKSLPDAPWKLDVAKSKDGKISIHQIVTPPGQPVPNVPMMGKLDAYFAFTSDTVVMSVGELGLKTIQDALEQMGKPGASAAAQIEASVALGKVMNFADTAQEKKTFGEISKQIFTGKDAGKDGLVASISGGDDSVKLKVSGDVVLLKFLMQVGFAVQAAPKP